MTVNDLPPEDPRSRPTIAVLISGSGRSLENLAQRARDGRLAGDIGLVISSSARAGGISRSRRFNLPCIIVDRSDYADDAAYSKEIFDTLRRVGVDLVVMAGFLKLLVIPDDFAGRVINIHPALLPRHGGKGMYGERVHAAVLSAGDRESGCSVHVADNEYDHGEVILRRTCPVRPDDTAETLAARVFELELEALPEAINALLGSLRTTGGRP